MTMRSMCLTIRRRGETGCVGCLMGAGTGRGVFGWDCACPRGADTYIDCDGVSDFRAHRFYVCLGGRDSREGNAEEMARSGRLVRILRDVHPGQDVGIIRLSRCIN
jgi:hypothetical protein